MRTQGVTFPAGQHVASDEWMNSRDGDWLKVGCSFFHFMVQSLQLHWREACMFHGGGTMMIDWPLIAFHSGIDFIVAVALDFLFTVEITGNLRDVGDEGQVVLIRKGNVLPVVEVDWTREVRLEESNRLLKSSWAMMVSTGDHSTNKGTIQLFAGCCLVFHKKKGLVKVVVRKKRLHGPCPPLPTAIGWQHAVLVQQTKLELRFVFEDLIKQIHHSIPPSSSLAKETVVGATEGLHIIRANVGPHVVIGDQCLKPPVVLFMRV